VLPLPTGGRCDFVSRPPHLASVRGVSDSPPPRDRLAALLGGAGLSRAEALALLVLVMGALAGLGLLWWAMRPPPAAGGPPGLDLGSVAAPEDPATESGEVVVHVAGLVVLPGVHRLPAGARVADAIEAAGGARAGAWLDGLNLARRLTDGEQLLVPAEGAPPPVGGDGGAGPASSGIRPDGTVDLNLATAAELQTLPGVGPVLSERIVAHREQHGPFASVGELRDVAGIGEKTFQALADLVSV
jgi:competence protein ComEA